MYSVQDGSTAAICQSISNILFSIDPQTFHKESKNMQVSDDDGDSGDEVLIENQLLSLTL